MDTMKTTRFVIGLVLVAASVLLLLLGDGDFTVPGASAIAILGIVLIAISRRR